MTEHGLRRSLSDLLIQFGTLAVQETLSELLAVANSQIYHKNIEMDWEPVEDKTTSKGDFSIGDRIVATRDATFSWGDVKVGDTFTVIDRSDINALNALDRNAGGASLWFAKQED